VYLNTRKTSNMRLPIRLLEPLAGPKGSRESMSGSDPINRLKLTALAQLAHNVNRSGQHRVEFGEHGRPSCLMPSGSAGRPAEPGVLPATAWGERVAALLAGERTRVRHGCSKRKNAV